MPDMLLIKFFRLVLYVHVFGPMATSAVEILNIVGHVSDAAEVYKPSTEDIFLLYFMLLGLMSCDF